MRREFVPVFLITGFIESGNVLVICCEEGETEYDEELLKKY